MGLWTCGNLALDARCPRRGGQATPEPATRHPRRNCHVLGIGRSQVLPHRVRDHQESPGKPAQPSRARTVHWAGAGIEPASCPE